jgi:hypothetical protein
MDFSVWEPVLQHPTIQRMPNDIFGITTKLCACVAQAENIQRPDGFLHKGAIPWVRIDQADLDRAITYLIEVGILEEDLDGLGYQFLNWTSRDKDMRPGGQVHWGQSPLEKILLSRAYGAKRSREFRQKAKEKLKLLTELHGSQLSEEELKQFPKGVDLETGEIHD